jgi:hypothetical protein
VLLVFLVSLLLLLVAPGRDELPLRLVLPVGSLPDDRALPLSQAAPLRLRPLLSQSALFVVLPVPMPLALLPEEPVPDWPPVPDSPPLAVPG